MSHTPADLAIFCKKKGFIYPSSEIYGGVAGLYDYGHLGTKLKKNFENLWRNYFLSLDDNYVEIETANIMHEKVFEASGHLKNMIDPLALCVKCGFRERADHLLEKHLKERAEGLSVNEYHNLITSNKISCPQCKSPLTASIFNVMFPLQVGVGKVQTAYLRPETAQSSYVNFKLQYEMLRKKLPLGLALIGRAYRNEISPRNLTLRQREFTQAELQIFFNPKKVNEHKQFNLVKNYVLRTQLVGDRHTNSILDRTAEQLTQQGLPQFYVYHLVKIQQFYTEQLHIPLERFRLYQLDDKEKAFYNKYHFDIEIDLHELGWTEMGGLHYRTDHDLSGHQRVSKESMEVLEEETGQKFIPHILELSFGVDRAVYALLDLNYEDNKERGNIILHFPPSLTPFVCGVFPLVKNKPEIVAKAEEVYSMVKKQFSCFWDESGSVGRRYARADEMGTRYCITIDFESVDDHAVTIRDRETTQQERVKINSLVKRLNELA